MKVGDNRSKSVCVFEEYLRTSTVIKLEGLVLVKVSSCVFWCRGLDSATRDSFDCKRSCVNKVGLNCQLVNFVRGKAINPQSNQGIQTVCNTGGTGSFEKKEKKLPPNGPLKIPD